MKNPSDCISDPITNMKFAVIVCVVVVGVAAMPQEPIYSSRYATVYYQGNVLDKQVPQTGYGLPSQDESTTESFRTTTQRDSEQIKDRENDALEGLKEEAVYYIYHPEGLLQRIVYLARDDPQNMAFTAQFKYENVEPIKDPIYTYNPETFVLQQLQR